jgi:hypothetical protein
MTYMMNTAFDPSTLPSVVVVDDYTVETALRFDSPVSWCDTCECWITEEDCGRFWVPTCFCA